MTTSTRWLSIDPGETVGWALWEGPNLIDAGQDSLLDFRREVGLGLLLVDCRGYACDERPNGRFCGVARLVIERFALYPWVVKTGALDFDEVRTARLIGALEFIADEAGLEVVFQPATIKQPALSMGAAELFQSPRHDRRHANDAIMHGRYYVVTEMLGTRVKLPSASALAIDPSKTMSDA